MDGAPVNAGVHWGPGLGDEIARSAGSGGFFSGNYVYPAEGFVYRDGSGRTLRRCRGQHRRGATGHVPLLRHRRPLLRRRGGRRSGQPAGRLRAPRALPDPATPPAVRQLVAFSAAFDAPPPALRFFVGPKQFEALAPVDPEFTKVINFGMFAILARAAARRAAMGERLRRQLRLVNRHPDHPHQPRDVAAAAQERRLDAAYAGAPAAAQSHPGPLLAPEDDRPGAAEDERRGDGPLQGQGRQPGQRLRADAAHHAGALRVLLAALPGDRDPRRALRRLDHRPLAARSVRTSPRC